jgi:hypothetical protein
MIIAGAFYPNFYAVKNTDDDEALKFLHGNNPKNTVEVSEKKKKKDSFDLNIFL